MSKFELMFVVALALSSGSAVAADGSERSQAFWKEYKAKQEQIRRNAENNVNLSKKSEGKSEKAERKVAKD